RKATTPVPPIPTAKNAPASCLGTPNVIDRGIRAASELVIDRRGRPRLRTGAPRDTALQRRASALRARENSRMVAAAAPEGQADRALECGKRHAIAVGDGRPRSGVDPRLIAAIERPRAATPLHAVPGAAVARAHVGGAARPAWTGSPAPSWRPRSGRLPPSPADLRRFVPAQAPGPRETFNPRRHRGARMAL